MTSKTATYIIAIVILVFANGYFFLSEDTIRNASFDDHLFSVPDTLSIHSIIIKNGPEIRLERKSEGWTINGRYKVDHSFMRILLSILNRVRIKRKTGELPRGHSATVNILFNNGESLSFDYGTDQLGTKTFFAKDQETYQVEVPGYRDNVANIFNLSEDQWRDRLVYDGNWRAIQRLTLKTEEELLDISFNNRFFEVKGIAPTDRNAVVGYLKQFHLFRANERISKGKFPQLDSLLSTNPFAVLTIEDIQKATPTSLYIYPHIEGQSYYLATNEAGEMMVFGASRIQDILKKRSDFRKID